jgi:hypothetical protein
LHLSFPAVEFFERRMVQFPLEMQLIHQRGTSSFLVLSLLVETGAASSSRMIDGLQCVLRLRFNHYEYRCECLA